MGKADEQLYQPGTATLAASEAAAETMPVGERGSAAPWYAFLALLTANATLAFGPWLVRLADTGPVAAGFWRLLLATPVLMFVAWRMRQPVGGFARPIWLLVIGAALFFALDLASWHFGIVRTKLANATLFGNSGSIVLVLYGLAIVRVWPRRAEWAAVALAFLGAALLMGQSYELSIDNLVGDLFCLMAGIFYVGYLLSMRRARSSMGQWSILAWVSLIGTAPMLAIALLAGETILPADWTPVVVLALSSQVLGQGLMVYSLLYFSPVVIGLALLTQPAIAALIGWLAFGEVLAVADWIGMAALGLALVLVRLPAKPRAALASRQ